jgi:hypothetical protein
LKRYGDDSSDPPRCHQHAVLPRRRYGQPQASGWHEIGLKLDLGRIDYWVSKGAQQSERVKHLVTSFRKANAA